VLSALVLLSASPALAGDDYVVPRTPTADTERGQFRYVHNFFSGITGTADNIADLVWGAGGLVAHTGGQLSLALSDAMGLADDNPLTRPITDGAASNNVALAGLFFDTIGTQMIEAPHNFAISGWPPDREWFLRVDDGGEGHDKIDYLHAKKGYAGLHRLPLEMTTLLIADGVVRPTGNLLRLFSLEESDAMEEWALDFLRSSLDDQYVPEEFLTREVIREVPVVEIREVPVETEVVREVFRTITTHNFTFRDVLFAHDSADLTDMGSAVCDQVMQALGDSQITQIVITGHTNDLGTDDYNLELGQRRAESVAESLAERGLAGDMMQISSRGESEPLMPNVTDVNRALNRRVEVQITSVQE
jgi:outer membrane protein OmpA-like peptidoglycan-associated protein